jgi:hypothetical protein
VCVRESEREKVKEGELLEMSEKALGLNAQNLLEDLSCAKWQKREKKLFLEFCF